MNRYVLIATRKREHDGHGSEILHCNGPSIITPNKLLFISLRALHISLRYKERGILHTLGTVTVLSQ